MGDDDLRGAPGGSEAGSQGGFEGGFEVEPGPPPTPFERAVDAPSVAPSMSPSSRPTARTVGAPRGGGRASQARRAVAILAAAVVGFIAGLAVDVELPDLPLVGSASSQGEREAALVTLLEDIVASEGIMLVFNDELTDLFDGAPDMGVAAGSIASAAEDGADGLRSMRPGLVAPAGDRAVDDVRSAYIPHLDSWIDYLSALAVSPELLFSPADQQPYLLLINSTAEAFADALEALLATDPPEEVVELAERILDEGFRSERDAEV